MIGRLRPLILLLVLLALPLTGSECDPPNDDDVAVYRISNPPPTSTAEIREESDQNPEPTIRLTRGVVLGVRCWDTCDFTCEFPELSTSSADVLRVQEVDTLSRTVPDFALIAVSPGSANLTVTTECATKTYRVLVLED